MGRNAVAFLALGVALGGTSYAAIKLPSNSVGKRQIKAKAVTSAKVRNGTLRTVDLSRKARSKLKGAQGLQGPAGPQGPKGSDGSPGPRGPADAFVYSSAADPPANPDADWTSLHPPTVMPGVRRALVFTSFEASVTCTADGPCSVLYGLYFGGNPVPRSASKVSSATSASRAQTVFLAGVVEIPENSDESITVSSKPSEHTAISSMGSSRTISAIALDP